MKTVLLPEGAYTFDETSCPVRIPDFENLGEEDLAKDTLRFLTECRALKARDLRACEILDEMASSIEGWLAGEVSAEEVDRVSLKTMKESFAHTLD